jgi:hypothetical protein
MEIALLSFLLLLRKPIFMCEEFVVQQRTISLVYVVGCNLSSLAALTWAREVTV